MVQGRSALRKRVLGATVPCFKISRKEDSGELEGESATTTAKYFGEAQGCFGGGVRKLQDGTLEGDVFPAKDFSGKQVLSPELLKKKMVAEEKDKQDKAHP